MRIESIDLFTSTEVEEGRKYLKVWERLIRNQVDDCWLLDVR